jgi:hypothetical protein
MVRVGIDFLRTMLRFPVPWLVWIAGLMLVNGILPLFFLPSTEAIVTLAVFMVAAMLQLTLFGRMGFVRFLGLGHAPWLFLVPWLWARLDGAPVDTSMRLWMWALIGFDSLSLLIDVADVFRYLRGETEPTLTLLED